MPLFVSRVLRNEVKVLATNNQRSMHLGRNHGSGKDTATNGDFAGEGTFLIYSFSVLYHIPSILGYSKRCKPM